MKHLLVVKSHDSAVDQVSRLRIYLSSDTPNDHDTLPRRRETFRRSLVARRGENNAVTTVGEPTDRRR